MLNIRQAEEKDNPQVLKILKELDLYYETLQLKDFWVAEKDNVIIGTVQINEYPGFFYLGALGITKNEQGKGFASSLLNLSTKAIEKPIYLYTVIPDYFAKHGFVVTPPIPGLPSKERYECESCHSDQCVTMVKLK